MKRHIALIMVMMLLFAAGAAFAEQASQVIPRAKLQQVIADFVHQKTASLGLETSIKRISLNNDLKLPAGTVTYDVLAPDQWEGWGRANLALIVRVNDQVEKNIPVNVDVDAYGEMVVSLRALDRGDVIGAGDVVLQKREVSATSGKFYANVTEVLGLRARTPIRANTPLRSEYLEKVPLVKTGQLVTIIAENQFIRLTATGRARGNGGEGDIVMVQNLGSHKEFPARVVDTGTVQVDF